MNAKFTKGPWIVNDGHYSRFLRGKITARFDGHDVVLCDTPSLIFGESESAANAHLIACAPDMYEMLERVMGNYQVLASIAAQNGIVFDEYTQDSKDTESLLKRARGEHE